MTKTCTACLQELPLESFSRHRRRPDGLEMTCRDCCKARKLRQRYKIDQPDYDRMFADQSGKCAICGRSPEDSTPLVVDHHHDSGEVRGLLCSPCNTAIGLLRENPQVLFKAAAYVSS